MFPAIPGLRFARIPQSFRLNIFPSVSTSTPRLSSTNQFDPPSLLFSQRRRNTSKTTHFITQNNFKSKMTAKDTTGTTGNKGVQICQQLLYSPTGDHLVAAFGNNLVVIQTSKNQIIAAPSCISTEENAESSPVPQQTFKPSELPTGTILSMSYCSLSNSLALITEDKGVYVYDCNNWSLKRRFEAVKRGNDVGIIDNGNTVLVADKFGDVYRFDVNAVEEKYTPVLAMGHVSLLTSLTVSPNQDLIITTDRDEHIRVTRYPATHTIESFCLGHKDLVTRFCIPPSHPTIGISGGAETWLGIWDYRSGKRLNQFDLTPILDSHKDAEFTVVKNFVVIPNSDLIALHIEKYPYLPILQVKDDSTLSVHKVVDLKCVPVSIAASRDTIFVSTMEATRVNEKQRKQNEDYLETYVASNASILAFSLQDPSTPSPIPAPIYQATTITDPFGTQKLSKEYLKKKRSWPRHEKPICDKGKVKHDLESKEKDGDGKKEKKVRVE